MADQRPLEQAARRIALAAAFLAVAGAITVGLREDRATPVHTVAAPEQVGSCRNSTDAACGSFRWDPQPANRPMTVEVTLSNTNPRIGELVTFTVTASDDAKFFPGDCGNEQFFGDTRGGGPCDVGCIGLERYGPWDPPAPANDRVVQQFTHTYERPGTFAPYFLFHFGERCVNDPYESDGQGTATITVAPAAAVKHAVPAAG